MRYTSTRDATQRLFAANSKSEQQKVMRELIHSGEFDGHFLYMLGQATELVDHFDDFGTNDPRHTLRSKSFEPNRELIDILLERLNDVTGLYDQQQSYEQLIKYIRQPNIYRWIKTEYAYDNLTGIDAMNKQILDDTFKLGKRELKILADSIGVKETVSRQAEIPISITFEAYSDSTVEVMKSIMDPQKFEELIELGQPGMWSVSLELTNYPNGFHGTGSAKKLQSGASSNNLKEAIKMIFASLKLEGRLPEKARLSLREPLQNEEAMKVLRTQMAYYGVTFSHEDIEFD